ncbi:DUF6397 family protein [Streptomyces sp. NPDC001795]|uniref:DUF6397 family protein n=1 Tax=unclassified Streptomyces TaxID=2593676 RepID=UPI00331669EA
MSARTITSTIAGTTGVVAASTARRSSLALSRAAQELDLKKGELDLAVQLGCVRTIPDEGGGGRRVTRGEIDRVRSEDGFPEDLRKRVRVVGTRDGAALMGVTPMRFTRFARLGLVAPVKWYLNRYRAVVWLYLAEEVREFAAAEKNGPLLTGRTPEGLRDQLDAGLDLRPRNWRGRNLGFQLRQTEDPWAKAAVVASVLDPVQVAEIVRDPYERAQLHRLRPAQSVHGAPDSPAVRIAARIMTAQDPDEIGWLRADLWQALIEARQHRPAPQPPPGAPDERPPELATAVGTTTLCGNSAACGNTTIRRAGTVRRATSGPVATTALQAPAVLQEATRSRGMFGWLRRRNP